MKEKKENLKKKIDLELQKWITIILLNFSFVNNRIKVFLQVRQ